MAKYKIGDTFITTITKANESGMGCVYELNDAVVVSDAVLSCMKPCISTVDKPKEDKTREYTLEELLERIFVITDLLNKTTEAYLSARSSLRKGIESADSGTEKLNA